MAEKVTNRPRPADGVSRCRAGRATQARRRAVTDEALSRRRPALAAAPPICCVAAASGATRRCLGLYRVASVVVDFAMNADFTPFMQAKVDRQARQQALKALFREPHFNAMDGSTPTSTTTRSLNRSPRSAGKALRLAGDQESATDGGGRRRLCGRCDQRRRAGDSRRPRRVTRKTTRRRTVHAEAAADSPDTPPPALHARYGTRVGDFSARHGCRPRTCADRSVPDSVTPVPALAGSTGAASDKPPAP